MSHETLLAADRSLRALPVGIREYFLPQNYSLPEAFQAAGSSTMPGEAMIEGVVYRPALIASANVRILDRKFGVDSEATRTAVVSTLEKRGSVRWEDYLFSGRAMENVEPSPVPSSRFSTIDSQLSDAKLMTALQRDFTDWVFRNSSVTAPWEVELLYPYAALLVPLMIIVCQRITRRMKMLYRGRRMPFVMARIVSGDQTFIKRGIAYPLGFVLPFRGALYAANLQGCDKVYLLPLTDRLPRFSKGLCRRMGIFRSTW